MRRSKKFETILSFLSIFIPGVGHAVFFHSWQGLTINLVWKLLLLSILIPVVGIKFYLVAIAIFLVGILLHSIVISKRVPFPCPSRIMVFISLFLFFDIGGSFFIRDHIMKYYRIHDISMEPALLDGDLVLLNRVSSHFLPFQKNDVVIFSYPQIKHELIKSIDSAIEQPEKENELFVLGDNRNHSLDSRALGTIPVNNVFGRVSRIVWSFDSVKRRIRWERIGVPITTQPL